jgi:hypothetical protein
MAQRARVVAVDHGLEFSAKEFFDRQNQVPARWSIAQGGGVHFLRRCSTGAHQKIDFYLNAVGPVRMIREIEIPLAQRVVVDAILKLVAEAGRDLLNKEGHVIRIAVTNVNDDGLAARAVEAVREWKFKPATDKQGNAVAVLVPIEATFRLY